MEPVRVRLIKEIALSNQVGAPIEQFNLTASEFRELRATAKPFDIEFSESGSHKFYGIPVSVEYGS